MTHAIVFSAYAVLQSAALCWYCGQLPSLGTLYRAPSRAAVRLRAMRRTISRRTRQRLALSLLDASRRISGQPALGWVPSVYEPNRVR
jgi:hypothetical protein